MAALDNLTTAVNGLKDAVAAAIIRETGGATEADVQAAADSITAVTADVNKIGVPQ